jgi:outer membrane protein
MSRTNFRAITGLMLAAAMMLQPVFLAAQSAAAPSTQQAAPEQMHPIGLPDFTKGPKMFPNVIQPYAAFEIAGPDYANGPGLDKLVREGKIYLSLADAITLSIENNIDVAIQRLNAPMADADILHTKAGTSPRAGLPSVTEGSAVGYGSGGSFAPTVSAAPLFGGAPGFNSGTSSFDPVLFGTVSAEHSTSLNTASLAQFGGSSPTTVSVITAKPNTGLVNLTYSQAFTSGTQLTVSANNNRVTSPFNTLNPQVSSYFSTTVTQHLLDGFGKGPNVRYLKIAKNNREVTDLAFKLQVITTVNLVSDLYWDLVSAAENIKVQERSLAVSSKLVNDDKRQVEVGTLAPISVVQAEAQKASDQQNLIIAQTNYQQLGVAMKNLILKNLNDPAVLTAEVVPTDKIEVPPVEPVVPIQDLVNSAISGRTELQESRININNRDMSIKTTKNSLLPQLDAFGTFTSRGVGGVGHVCPNASTPCNAALVPFAISGFGGAFGDAVGGLNPDYTLGVQFSMVLRNRSAQADLAQALVEKRQANLRLRQIENQVKVEVVSAQIGLTQGRAQIEAAMKQRVFEEQSLDAEQKKFALGASTSYLVIQVTRDLVNALSAEVAAKDAYMKARVEMDRCIGQTLMHNNIILEEAAQGALKHPPTPVPVSKQD